MEFLEKLIGVNMKLKEVGIFDSELSLPEIEFEICR